MATAKTTEKKPAPRARRPAPRGEEIAPQYEVTEQSFIDNKLLQPGQHVTYYGVPGKALKPLNTAAKANKAAAQEARRDTAGDPEARTTALRYLDNDLQNITPRDEYDDEEEITLSDAERTELEGHAETTVKQQAELDKANTNKVGVQLSGNPADPEGKLSQDGLQGNTPVKDAKGK